MIMKELRVLYHPITTLTEVVTMIHTGLFMRVFIDLAAAGGADYAGGEPGVRYYASAVATRIEWDYSLTSSA